jgi:transposase-like protein
MAEHRRTFTATEKAKIIREGLSNQSSISELCRHYGISATQYYDWQRRFLDSAIAGLENRPKGGERDKQRVALERAENKIARLQHVIAEITSENIALDSMEGPH